MRGWNVSCVSSRYLLTYHSVLTQAEDRSLSEKIIEIHEEYAALVVRQLDLTRLLSLLLLISASKFELCIDTLWTLILQKSSVNRINYLKSLVEFMSEATKELIWMNQREEPEVSRDWSITDHDIEDLQAHGEVL